MTTKTLADRALPFSAAATIAVLLMALVVSPLRAQTAPNPCTSCINWIANSPASPCAQYDKNDHRYNSPYNICKNQKTQEYCNMTTSPFAKNGVPPCQQGVTSGESDCSSDGCNFFDGIPDVYLCSWDCWNRTCEQNTSKVCTDTMRKGQDCASKQTTAQCSKCECK